jgi:DNA end-binding protein Ku
VAVRALDDVMVLHTLRFHDEVVSPDELETKGGGRGPSRREVQMAAKLVESLDEPFRPENYEDTYRNSVLEMIKRKAAGKEIDSSLRKSLSTTTSPLPSKRAWGASRAARALDRVA